MGISKSALTTSFIIGFGVILGPGCSDDVPRNEGVNTAGHTSPTPSTIKANREFLNKRPFVDTSDFDDARKGLMASVQNYKTTDANGTTVFNTQDFSFVDPNGQNPPASVNPSLWRQAALNNIHGLFKVTDGLYQIRGTDLANMTIIEGNTGWIIVDPLTSKESASDSLLLAQEHLGKKPIIAILFTHSHADHFAGVDGILAHMSQQEINALRIIAPEGFVEEVTSENIIAGVAMARRAGFMYGRRLPINERGHIDTGLGKLPIIATLTFKQPTETVSRNNLDFTIDGVPFEFQIVSGSEAPSEFTFYLPDHKAFCGAELVSRTMHNLYTLRGAKVRDARLWSGYIDEAISRFGEAEVYFASHHWPLWGNEKIRDFMEKQRDTYRYIHDQTVRLMNQGMTPNEIANSIRMPDALTQDFHNQGYYGTIEHNSKAVYQFYLGWYNGNPAKLHPLAEAESARRYVSMMGGMDALLNKANDQFEKAGNAEAGDGNKTYRWLAELLNHAVFADPSNKEAKALLAKTYDQLGYQAESGPWRDVYLSAAYELRHGAPEHGLGPAALKQILEATPVPLFLDSMSVRLDADKAEGANIKIKLNFTDINESYLVVIKNSVMHHRQSADDQAADAILNLTFPLFVGIIVGEASLKDLLFSDDLSVEGSSLDLLNFVSMIEKPTGTFNVVTP